MASLDQRLSALSRRRGVRTLVAPAGLLGLAVLAYGVGIQGGVRLGFFWDDWVQVYVHATRGAGALREALAFDRPGLGVLATVTDPLVGSDDTRAFLFGLATHWLAAVALFWLLVLVWPLRRREAFLAAALFLVYPGFSQQYVSITYGRIFLALALGLLSFCLMIRAQGHRLRVPITVLALVLGGVAAVVEYFVALELLRPAVLWKVLPRDGAGPVDRRRRAREVLRAWLPYLAMLAAFVLWRLLFFSSGRQETNSALLLSRLADNPVGELRHTLGAALSDLVEVAVLAFGRALDPAALIGGGRLVLGSVALAVVAAATVVLGSRLLARDDPAAGDAPRADRAWARTAMLVGGAAMVLGGIPQWFAGQFASLAGLPGAIPIANDRFTLAMAVGACLLIVGFLSWATPRPRVVAGLTAGMVALSLAYQYRNGNDYQENLRVQAQFDWQFSWRVPALAPGTVLVSDRLAFAEAGAQDSVAIPLLFAYDPHNRDGEMPFWVRFGDDLAPHLADPTAPVLVDARGVRFDGRFDDRVVLWFDPPSCLRVLRGKGDVELPGPPSPALYLAADSQPGRILATSARQTGPSSPLWGPEIGHGWCWSFQRMELARQVGDTAEYARLADDALARKLAPADPNEWLDVIEAYVLTDRADDAGTAVAAAQKVRASPEGLCALRRHLAATGAGPATLDQAFRTLTCPTGG